MKNKERNFCCGALWLLLFTLLGGCDQATQPGAEATSGKAASGPAVALADTVFVNARVYTMNEQKPWAEAVAVAGERIVYVGDADGAQAYIGSATELRDVGGSFVLPGLIDTHMHPIYGGAFAQALSLDTFGGVEGWVAAIADYAQEHPDAALLFGYGFLASTFGPEGPTRQQIDAVVPDRPVLIMDEGFHGAWANSRALKALGLDRATPDPVPGFSYYKRESNGDLSGYLLEDTAGMAMQGLNVITEDVVTSGTALVFDTLNSYGVTAVFDAGVGAYADMLPRVLKRLEEAGDMSVRVVGSYRPSGPEQKDDAVATAVRWGKEIRGDRYHYRMLKLMDDGTVEGRTAAMFEDYQGEPGNDGATVFTQAELSTLVADATQAGIDVHIHALGERAVHEALNAIETARAQHADRDNRYTICHIQVIADEDLPRFAELDVIAQSTPLWAAYDTYGKAFVSDDQFQRYWRFASLRDLGVKLTFGSDFPASGAGMLGMSPLFNIEIGHTRQEPGDAESLVQPRASERLDIDTLLRGYTIDAAWQLRLEDEIGSLAVGKRADLVVLDGDPFESSPYDIHRIGVTLTMMDGAIVYEKGR